MKTTNRLLLALAYAATLFTTRAADTSISGLPAASSVTSSNLTIVVDTSEPNPALRTKKATVTQLIGGLPQVTVSTDGKMIAADKALLDTKTSTATANALVRRDGSGNAAFNAINLTSGTVTAAPLVATDIANKGYVDASAAGLTVKAPVVAATTANVTLAGGAPNAIDGVSLNTNNRVLVKDQTDLKENGIYTVQTLGSGVNGTWVRALDADTGAELPTGSYVFVPAGTAAANSAWVMTTPGAITIGTSNIVWTLYTQITNILASNIIGQIISAQIADAAISTAKFASGITPVEVFGSLPGSGNFAGRTVFLTSDSKLYRYNGSAFISTTAAGDVTGQITTTQITDGAISTPKLQAGSVTANEIAADTITAGQIAAGAINTSELAANAVNASKILAGSITTTQIAASTILGGNIAAGTVTASNIAASTITADKMNVSSLSAISANLGTITAGTINAVTINAATLGVTSTIQGVSGSSFVKILTSGNWSFSAGQALGYTMTMTGDSIVATNTSAQTNAVFTGGSTGGGEIRLYNNTGPTQTVRLTGGTAIGSGRGALGFQTATFYESGSNNLRTNSSVTVDLFLTSTLTAFLNGGVVTTTGSFSGLLSGATISTTGGITGPGPGSANVLGYNVVFNPSTSNHNQIGAGITTGSDHAFTDYIILYVSGNTVYVPVLYSAP